MECLKYMAEGINSSMEGPRGRVAFSGHHDLRGLLGPRINLRGMCIHNVQREIVFVGGGTLELGGKGTALEGHINPRCRGGGVRGVKRKRFDGRGKKLKKGLNRGAYMFSNEVVTKRSIQEAASKAVG